MTRIYNDPAGGSASDIGAQIRIDKFEKKALIEAAKVMPFGQMADTTTMPKHMGKKISQFHYLPLLDDANINDQGIDANGVTTLNEVTIIISDPSLLSTGNGYTDYYAIGEGVNAAAAQTAAEAQAMLIFRDKAGIDITAVATDTYAEAVAVLEALTPAWVITSTTAVNASGNIYGSSKDVGYITGKLPSLTENGGTANRVGFTRVTIESKLNKYGFYHSYTKESLDFDSDAELDNHLTSELIKGGNELSEDLLQLELLAAAGVVRFGGAAVSDATVTGEGTLSIIDYNDLMRLEIDLDDNRCPKNTTVVYGSKMIDTRVIEAARYLYIGSELIPMIKRMKDNFNNQAFIDKSKYGSATTTIPGEIGSIGGFRIVVVQEMMHWAGVGATVTANEGYRSSNTGAGEKYDVFPMLVIGDKSFTTVGFQTDGKTTKFTIKHVKPESESSYSLENDPFGEQGFSSLKFYFGFMALRPERIALVKTVAEI